FDDWNGKWGKHKILTPGMGSSYSSVTIPVTVLWEKLEKFINKRRPIIRRRGRLRVRSSCIAVVVSSSDALVKDIPQNRSVYSFRSLHLPIFGS
ncbi:MAG: hypothetical protein AAFQ98_07255, partial [Bacteroidota bacterium]